MSDSSESTPEPELCPTQTHVKSRPQRPGQNGKRSAADAGLKTGGARSAKSAKRRASKACQCCRARKVRCNVVEHGAPCTNCRLDEVECIVSESKRKKKWTSGPDATAPIADKKGSSPVVKPAVGPASFPMSAAPPYEPLRRHSEHVPHALCTSLFHYLSRPASISAISVEPQTFSMRADEMPTDQDLNRDIGLGIATNDTRSPAYMNSGAGMMMGLQQRLSQPQQQPNTLRTAGTDNFAARMLSPESPGCSLPAFIKPLSTRFGTDEIAFLERKGALTIPPAPLRDELLRSYAEYVHPYMPLMSLRELVVAIDRNDGVYQVGLLLFQAIMFAGVATADMQQLRCAGYKSRRDARRDFFQKARILYDFDVELDRISLIQALLLMTYWYETPDDLKDSHHWMGIAVSLAHSIGLHRNLDTISQPLHIQHQELARRRLWRRVWWATYMRDRLIAFGMRRPTRISSSDFDVPMLTLEDFEIEDMPLPPGAAHSCIALRCKPVRDGETQRRLAIMCIEKVRLCVAMSHVLSVQYSVLHNNHVLANDDTNANVAASSTRTTMMLAAKQLESAAEEVQACDMELQAWYDNLPSEAQYVTPAWTDVTAGDSSLVLNRCLLHMMYFATLSALHRPQVLPSPTSTTPSASAELIEMARRSVRLAASEITDIANSLDRLGLVKCLPTTGITVLLPAIIIHLLDIKAPEEVTRRSSLKGFCDCMQIMAKLRDMYAAADYSTAFLEAAIRKADISLPQRPDEIRDPRNVITSSQGLVEAGRRMQLAGSPTFLHGNLTPPPDDKDNMFARAATYPPSAVQHGQANNSFSDDDEYDDDDDDNELIPGGVHLAGKLNNYLDTNAATTSENLVNGVPNGMQAEYEPDFDSLINLDDTSGDVWSLDDTAYAAMQGESSVFAVDMGWMKRMRQDDGAMVAMAGVQDYIS